MQARVTFCATLFVLKRMSEIHGCVGRRIAMCKTGDDIYGCALKIPHHAVKS